MSTVLVYDRTNIDAVIATAILGTHLKHVVYATLIAPTDASHYIFIGVEPSNDLLNVIKKRSITTYLYHDDTLPKQLEDDYKIDTLIDRVIYAIHDTLDIATTLHKLSLLIYMFMSNEEHISMSDQALIYKNYMRAIDAIDFNNTFTCVSVKQSDINEYINFIKTVKRDMSQNHTVEQYESKRGFMVKAYVCNIRATITPWVLHLAQHVHRHVLLFEYVKGQIAVTLHTDSTFLKENLSTFFSDRCIRTNTATLYTPYHMRYSLF